MPYTKCHEKTIMWNYTISVIKETSLDLLGKATKRQE